MCVFINLYYFCRQHTKKCIYCIQTMHLGFYFCIICINFRTRTDTNLHKCIYDKKKYNKTKEYYTYNQHTWKENFWKRHVCDNPQKNKKKNASKNEKGLLRYVGGRQSSTNLIIIKKSLEHTCNCLVSSFYILTNSALTCLMFFFTSSERKTHACSKCTYVRMLCCYITTKKNSLYVRKNTRKKYFATLSTYMRWYKIRSNAIWCMCAIISTLLCNIDIMCKKGVDIHV